MSDATETETDRLYRVSPCSCGSMRFRFNAEYEVRCKECGCIPDELGPGPHSRPGENVSVQCRKEEDGHTVVFSKHMNWY